MSEQEARLVAQNLDADIANAAKATNNPWVGLFTGILLKHGIYAMAFVAIGYMYMEKDKSYQLSRDAELDRYINIIQKHTVLQERLINWLDRQQNYPPPGAR